MSEGVIFIKEEKVIELINISKQYHGVWVLKDLSAQFNRGISVIIGPNGSGKSTLLKIIAGLVFPDSGEVLINGKKLSKKQKKEIGIVHENNAIYPYISIYNYSIYVAKIYGLKDAKLAAEKLLKEFDLITDSEKTINELSAGMRQRFFIGLSLMVNPKIMLLDEPYANLDVDWRQRITKIIMEYVKSSSEKPTIIVTTHMIGEAKNLADYVFFMHDGKLLQVDKDDIEKMYLKIMGGL